MKRTLCSLCLALLLAACAGAPPSSTTPERRALQGLSQRAAEAAMTAPHWAIPAEERVLLLAPPQVDADLPIATDTFREALTRALLGRDGGPQVLNWTPTANESAAPDNQWILESRLQTEGPILALSDRRLLPYRLELTLRRPGSDAPRWRYHIDGALDASAL